MLAISTATLGTLRALTMAIAFGVVSLSYYVLSATDFALFNLLAFFLALGSSVSGPLNRAFWARDSLQNFGPASVSAAGITGLVVIVGLLLTGGAGPFRVVLAVAGGAYAIAKILERYGYGRLLVAQQSARAILPSIVFAGSEAAVVAGMWVASSRSLLLRVVLPTLLFFVTLALTSLRTILVQFWRAAKAPGASIAFAREHLISRMGARVLALGALATLAGMGERLLIRYMPLGNAKFSAAYLLVLSYSVAFQTLMSFLFDLARTNVFRDRSWQPQARRFTVLSVAVLAGIIGAAILAYPILTRLKLIPTEISQLLWAGLLMRSTALMLVLSFNVDRFQEGDLRHLALPNAIILAAAAASFYLLHHGSPQRASALILIIVCVGTTAFMGLGFFRRVGLPYGADPYRAAGDPN